LILSYSSEGFPIYPSMKEGKKAQYRERKRERERKKERKRERERERESGRERGREREREGGSRYDCNGHFFQFFNRSILSKRENSPSFIYVVAVISV